MQHLRSTDSTYVLLSAFLQNNAWYLLSLLSILQAFKQAIIWVDEWKYELVSQKKAHNNKSIVKFQHSFWQKFVFLLRFTLLTMAPLFPKESNFQQHIFYTSAIYWSKLSFLHLSFSICQIWSCKFDLLLNPKCCQTHFARLYWKMKISMTYVTLQWNLINFWNRHCIFNILILLFCTQKFSHVTWNALTFWPPYSGIPGFWGSSTQKQIFPPLGVKPATFQFTVRWLNHSGIGPRKFWARQITHNNTERF